MELVKEIQNKQQEIKNISNTIDQLNKIDIDDEEQIHNYNNKLAKEEMEYKTLLVEHNQNKMKCKSLDKELATLNEKIKRIDSDIANMQKNICPTCGQEIGKEESAKMVEQKNNDKKLLQETYHKTDLDLSRGSDFPRKDF